MNHKNKRMKDNGEEKQMRHANTNQLKLPVLSLVALLGAVACNIESDINDYFAKFGLNRLAAPRTDLNPGALILSSPKGALYADNMLDYVAAQSTTTFPVSGGDRIGEYQAVLKTYTKDRSVDGSLALKFLDTFVPGLHLSETLKLTSKVTIDLINAKVRRMSIPSIQQFLRSPEGAGFRTAVVSFSKTSTPYIAYETWHTNKLKISAAGGAKFDTSVGVGKVLPVLADGSATFTYTFNSDSELELTGGTYYVFAVRTARLVPAAGDLVTLDPVNFAKPKDWGIMGAGSDEKFSAPIQGNFAPLTLQHK
jgi:hypothetical protein